MGIADLPLLWSGIVFVTLVLIHHNRPDWTGALGQAAQVNRVNMTSLELDSAALWLHRPSGFLEHAIPNLHRCQFLMQIIHKQIFYIFVLFICNFIMFCLPVPADMTSGVPADYCLLELALWIC